MGHNWGGLIALVITECKFRHVELCLYSIKVMHFYRKVAMKCTSNIYF